MKTLDNKRKVILLYNFDACGWGEFEGVNVKLFLLRCEQVGCIIKSGEAKPDNSTLPLLAELVSLYDEEGETPVNLQHRLLPELRLFV